jgi:hypothetical protein
VGLQTTCTMFWALVNGASDAHEPIWAGSTTAAAVDSGTGRSLAVGVPVRSWPWCGGGGTGVVRISPVTGSSALACGSSSRFCWAITCWTLAGNGVGGAATAPGGASRAAGQISRARSTPILRFTVAAPRWPAGVPAGRTPRVLPRSRPVKRLRRRSRSGPTGYGAFPPCRDMNALGSGKGPNPYLA